MTALDGGTISLQGTGWLDSGVNDAGASSAFSITGSLSNSGNTLALSGPGTFTSSGLIQGGTISVAAATRLELSGTVDGVTVDGNVTVSGNSGVTVQDGLTLNGTATLGAASSSVYGYMNFMGSQTLSGTGTVVFGQYSPNTLLLGQADTTLTIGSGITVRGQSGGVGYNPSLGLGTSNAAVVNQGTIQADVAGGTITVDGTSDQNAGNLDALNGATLSILGALANVATVSVDATSVLSLGGTLTGGTIDTQTGAQIYGSTLDAVTIDGNFTVSGDSSVTVQDGLTLNGTLTLGAASSSVYGYLNFMGSQTLSGTGTVVFGQASPNTLLVGQAGTTLTIGSGITVRGQSGAVGYNPSLGLGTPDAAVVNQGTIQADVAGGTITVYGAAAAFSNSGTVNASAGSVNIYAGSYGAVNSGTLSVGPTGTFQITGPFTQSGSGNFDVVLGGATTGHYGQVTIDGTASLAGSLNISEANGFSPSAGDVFTFLTYTSATGQFANYSGLILSSSAALEPAYNSTSVTLTTVADTTTAADLRVTNLAISPANPQSSQSVTVNWDDSNDGNGAATGSWTDYVVVTNTTTGQTMASAYLPYNAATQGAIAPGGSAALSYTFQLPNGPAGVGNLLVSVTTDYYDSIPEYYPGGVGYTNNTTIITAVSTLAAYPDLQVTGLSITPSSLESGDSVTVSWNDANTGNGPVSGSFSDYHHGAQHHNRPDPCLGRHPL